MLPDYRLIAVDLDGTLLDSTGRVPPANRAALRRARRAGLFVCLCTSRNHLESRDVLGCLDGPPDGFVSVFGAVVCEPRTGRPLAVRTIDRTTVHQAVDWFGRRGFPCVVTHEGYTAGFHSYAICKTGDDGGARRNLRRWMSATVGEVRQVPDWPADAPPAVRIGSVVARADAARLETEFLADFSGRLTGQTIYAPNYDLWVLEFFAAGVNKWTGLLPLARARGIEPGRIVAVGDDRNDIDLVANAGLGVAVANADSRVKAVADRIVPSNDEAGVAVLIDRLLADVGDETGRADIPG